MVLLMGFGIVQLEVCLRERQSGDGTRWLGRLKEVYSVCIRNVKGTVCLLGYLRASRYPLLRFSQEKIYTNFVFFPKNIWIAEMYFCEMFVFCLEK